MELIVRVRQRPNIPPSAWHANTLSLNCAAVVLRNQATKHSSDTSNSGRRDTENCGTRDEPVESREATTCSLEVSGSAAEQICRVGEREKVEFDETQLCRHGAVYIAV